MSAPKNDSVCKSCGASLGEAFRFCPSCGQASEPFAIWPGERRFVTILFADVSGFSRMTERMDPEEVTNFLNLTFERLEKTIVRYGGTVDKYIGDCVMALFGVPKAHGNDAERACLTALEMMKDARELNAGKSLPERLNLSIGVNAGTVIVGSIGGATAKQNTVIGDAVNVAQRLQSIAQPGQIMTSGRVARLCEAKIRFQSVGEFYVKGKNEPIPSYLVTGLVEERDEEQPEIGRRSIFVGRIAEQRAIKEAIKGALNDKKQRFLAYAGKAGLGKTRLGEEGMKIAEKAGFIALSCPSPEFAGGKDYGLVTGLVERALFALGGEAQNEEELSLEEILKGIKLSEPARERLKEILGLAPASDGEMEESNRRFSVYYAVRELLNLLCERAPLHIFMPNIQWADNASVSFIKHLEENELNKPLVWAFTSENPETLPFAAGERKTILELKELSREDTIALAQAISGNVGIEPELAELLWERTGGNPFYLEELISSLWYQKAIEQTDKKLSLTADLDKLELPDSLTAVIAARIDRLPNDAREVIRYCSVIGRKFSTPVVHSLSAYENIDDIIGLLDSQGFIERQHGDADGTWTFVHDLTRRVAYEGLLLKTRKELHRRVASALEAQGEAEANPDWLAHHWNQAGDIEKYIRYRLIAAMNKQRVCQYDAALERFDEVISKLSNSMELDDEEKINSWALSAYTGRGEVYLVKGEYEAASKDFVRGVDIARKRKNVAAEILLEANQTKLYFLWNDLDFALVHGKEALKMSELHKNEAGKGLALHRIGLIHFRRGNIDEAKNSLEEALAIRRKIGDRAGQSASLNSLGNILLRAGDAEAANRCYEDSLAICREIGDRLGIAACLNNLGHLASNRGEFDKAVAYLSEALEIKREIGDRRGAVAAMVNLAEAYFQLGKFAEAEKMAAEAGELSEEIHFKTGLVYAGFLKGRCLSKRKEFAKAAKEIMAAIEAAESGGLTEDALNGKVALADVLLEEGEIEEAKKLLAEVLNAATDKNIQSVAREAERRLKSL